MSLGFYRAIIIFLLWLIFIVCMRCLLKNYFKKTRGYQNYNNSYGKRKTDK